MRSKYIIDEEFKEYMTKGSSFFTNNQIVFRFPNGYGASVINGPGSYGLELMRIFFTDNNTLYYSYELCEEPYGWLTNEQMNKMLHNIKETGYAKGETE